MAKILIIDDDELMRTMMLQMLSRAGHQMTEASNGVEGLAAYRHDPADLVITDLIMPEKEGIETIMELRREFPRAKIIAISGGGRNGTLDFLPIAKKLGALRTLSKPFERQALIEAVDQVLAKAEAVT